MLDTIKNFISRYIVLPTDELEVISTYIFHTWQFSESCPTPYTTPYLYIHSSQKGSGKTTLGVDVMEVLTRNPVPTVAVTAAALFRLIENMQPTLIIDEVDTVVKTLTDMRGILNAGYRRGGKIPRTMPGEDGGVGFFSPFCPKVLIGIETGALPDTVTDRCIPIAMKRATTAERETVSDFYHYEIEEEVEVLAAELHAWAVSHGADVHGHKPREIPGLSPRQWEISRPLIQVAHYLGNEAKLRKALSRIFAEAIERDTREVTVLKTAQALYANLGRANITTNELLKALEEDDRFKGMSGTQLAALLRPLGAEPGTLRVPNLPGTHKGYKRSTFVDAFERYI